MKYCPYAQRAHLVLDAKQIPHHVIYINLFEKPEWYFDINPYGKVPSLEIAPNKYIYESLLVAEYLEESYPQVPLLPKDPFERATQKILIERWSGAVLNNVYKLYGIIKANGEDVDTISELKKGLQLFDDELTRLGTTYYSGNTIGYVDYMIWPWVERIVSLGIFGGSQFNVDVKEYANFVSIQTYI